ncbi:MAG: prepilin-type N-terminal cleavage/methylation domain-containing protein [Desulforhopalus sp.]|jgi:prepilin-type N-terminal cleavage/methylation domain-containing protein
MTIMDFVKKECGFTLIETVIAIFILVIGIMSLYSMQISSIQGNAGANRITLGTSWGQDQIEEMLLRELEDIPAAFSKVEKGVSVYTPNIDLAINNSVKKWKEIIKLDNTDDGGRISDQDPDQNGLDDDGVDGITNFGLDNTTAPAADYTRQSPDGRFTIYYNFAVNVPLPRVVTVRVIVQENNTNTGPVVFTYRKDDII